MPQQRCEEAGLELQIRVSVAAPAYNEEAGIASVIESWLQYL
jgi:hypothetical protein